MKLPFTREEFLELFKAYNLGIYPMQLFFYLLAVLILFFSINQNSKNKNYINGSLAFLWLWMGIIYHLFLFTRINPAAWLFGFLFILQAYVLIHYGFIRKKLFFQFKSNLYGWTGALLILYALVIYPVLGQFSDHPFPYNPGLGLPCPTTIFTLGIYLWQDKKLPVPVLLLPLLWSVIGSMAAIYLGIAEDTGLIASGLVSGILLLVKDRRSKSMASSRVMNFKTTD